MKKLIPLLLLLGIVCGCHSGQNDTATSQTGKTRQDSLALKVALMPTLDCLPFYYAQRCGLFKELGLDIRLQTFNAQMDCDTAFARRHGSDSCGMDAKQRHRPVRIHAGGRTS